MLIGEIYLPVERLAAYYGRDLCGAHLPFNFSLLETPWQARAIAALIDRYEAALPEGAWPNWVLGNHDRPRLASRVGDAQTRVAAMLLLTLRGTPTLYYGDEIGMRQVAIAPSQVRDPLEKNVPGFGVGRDGCRTPMQWDSRPLPDSRRWSHGCRWRTDFAAQQRRARTVRPGVAVQSVPPADRPPPRPAGADRRVPIGRSRRLAMYWLMSG